MKSLIALISIAAVFASCSNGGGGSNCTPAPAVGLRNQNLVTPPTGPTTPNIPNAPQQPNNNQLPVCAAPQPAPVPGPNPNPGPHVPVGANLTEGNWESECVAVQGQNGTQLSASRTYIFKGNVVSFAQFTFTGEGCQNQNLAIINGGQGTMGAANGDVRVVTWTSVSLKPMTQQVADNLNQLRTCGKTDWTAEQQANSTPQQCSETNGLLSSFAQTSNLQITKQDDDTLLIKDSAEQDQQQFAFKKKLQ